ncbi:MAG: aminopeptidase, partial [Rickettsiales bacterium]
EEDNPPLAPVVNALATEWAGTLSSDYTPDAGDLIDLIHRTQRVEMIYAAGQQHNHALIADVLGTEEPVWSDIEPLPTDSKPQERLAENLIAAVDLEDDDILMVTSVPEGKQVAEKVVETALERGMEFDVSIRDQELRMKLMNAATPEQVEAMAEHYWERFEPTTKNIIINANENPAIVEQQDQSKEAMWKKIGQPFNDRRGDESHERHVQWTLTYIPTQQDVDIDGIEYEEYLDLFFEMCDQPWAEIEKAHKVLCKAFGEGKDVHITNNDGTDIRFDIEGHTFAQEPSKINIPGSEFFSAPVKDSVNGTIVAKGTFSREGLMEDISLTFENGRIVKWDAKEGKDTLTRHITKGDDVVQDTPEFEGTRYLGELAFGTNPHLTRHVANPLLVEKIGGSFHVALGKAYGDGWGAKIDNGNRAPNGFHWDVTTMLKGKEGEVYLDGHLMQKDGKWLAVPELGISEKDVAVLNDGWRAVPEHKRPKYWRDKIAAEDQTQERGAA